MRKFKKVIPYIITPVVYALLGYLFIIVALSPIIKLTGAVGGMLVKDSAPNFNSKLSVIYDPEAHKNIVTQEIPFSEIQFPSRGEQYANISCEEMGLNVPLYWGDADEMLRYGAGQYTGSYIPGDGRLIFIAGHNATFFNCFQNADVGQIITITTNYGVFQYEIYQTDIINAEAANKKYTEWLKDEEETLMMYTCYPFGDVYGFKADRLFLFCKKISGPVLVN